jgi:glycosyltransferase involved in cell wall biosynthesis
MRVTILAFNYGLAGQWVNGPGMCLVNFVKILKENGIHVSILTELPSEHKRLTFADGKSAIDSSDIVINWSGISERYYGLMKYAQKIGKITITGPNVIDTADLIKEEKYLGYFKPDHLFTVNERLQFKIEQAHGIKAKKFIVGPDLSLWQPDKDKKFDILWKGNSKHKVKDVAFGLKVAEKLKEYSFEFIGYPKPYHYMKHIEKAKKTRIYICTSISETMGLALAEQMAAGIPSIIHPKIYGPFQNYKTGIICSRDVDSYVSSIKEILSNERMLRDMSEYSYEFSKSTFSSEAIFKTYLNILDGKGN